MIVALFFVLILASIPLTVVIVKVRNGKIVKRLKTIKKELVATKSLDTAKVLRNEATELILTIWKPDLSNQKQAELLVNDIKELVSEVK